MSYELEGTVKVIMDTMSFPSGFTKREFVVEKGGQYPQPIKFVCVKDRIALIDSISVGQNVKVHFDVRGNENQGRYFVDLNAWKIDVGAGGGEAPPAAAGGAATAGESDQHAGASAADFGAPSGAPDAFSDEADDDLPF